MERLFGIGLLFCVAVLAAGTSLAEEQRLDLDETVTRKSK